jgi:hypothetical protein
MDDERLKQLKHFGEDYFEELLERIREIRLSERRLYQKITDIYALSADYDNKSEITQHFFASVQNKLHWAITGKTAAEIIYTEADATKIYMGLKTWKQAPDGKILKSDVTIAKNYLNAEHLKALERIVTSYLDLAENRARNRQCNEHERLGQLFSSIFGISGLPYFDRQRKNINVGSKAKSRK